MYIHSIWWQPEEKDSYALVTNEKARACPTALVLLGGWLSWDLNPVLSGIHHTTQPPLLLSVALSSHQNKPIPLRSLGCRYFHVLIGNLSDQPSPRRDGWGHPSLIFGSPPVTFIDEIPCMVQISSVLGPICDHAAGVFALEASQEAGLVHLWSDTHQTLE